MRTLLLTAMMLCASLFTPGCTGGEDEEVICEDTITLTQYEVYECEFTGTGWTHISIMVDGTDSSSTITAYTIPPDQYDSWMNCEDFEMMVPQYRLRTNDGAKDFGLERFGWEDFYVVFEHRDSCEDEETDRGVADFYFKVVVT